MSSIEQKARAAESAEAKAPTPMMAQYFEEGKAPRFSHANPLQVFRMAAIMLVRSAAHLLGPAAFVTLDMFAAHAYLAWAIIYAALLAAIFEALGYWRFRRGDLV